MSPLESHENITSRRVNRNTRSEVFELLWIRIHLGISWQPRDLLNGMSTKDCFMNHSLNMLIYGQRLEVSIGLLETATKI